jgi:isopenicillin N synthase-like dioxygenase
MRPYAAALCRRTLRAGRFLCVLFRRRGQANLRFLHYPPQAATEDNTFGQGPHTDNSFFTALARTEVPGLTVRLPSGEWFAAPVIAGTFLINLGNIMRRWSNGRFLSTAHGVLNDSGTDRYWIAYFHGPKPGPVIECLSSRTGPDNPARYPPAVYRDLVLEFYRANYFHQKGHRSAAAAQAAE